MRKSRVRCTTGTCDCGRKKELLHIVRGGLSAAGLKNVEN